MVSTGGATLRFVSGVRQGSRDTALLDYPDTPLAFDCYDSQGYDEDCDNKHFHGIHLLLGFVPGVRVGALASVVYSDSLTRAPSTVRFGCAEISQSAHRIDLIL